LLRADFTSRDLLAAVQGYDRSYARSHKVAAGIVVATDAPGVTYTVSVSGPKMYQLDNLHMKLVAKTCQEAILPDHRIPIRLTARLPMPLNCGAASTCVDHAPRQAGASAVTAARGL
jgi:hypothetical protein